MTDSSKRPLAAVDDSVLIISAKSADYIRTVQLRELAEMTAKKVEVRADENKSVPERIPGLREIVKETYPGSYDVIIAAFLPQLIVPGLAKRMKKAPVRPKLISDFFISMYDTICLDRKLIPAKSPAGRYLFELDKKTLELSDEIITDTESDADFFSKIFGVSRSKFRTIYLEADKKIYNKETSASGKAKNGNEPFRVLYFGTGLRLQGIDVILEAMKIVSKALGSDISFTFVGKLNVKQRLKARRTRSLKHIEWLSQRELAKRIAESDLCLAGHFAGDNDKAARVIPGKAMIYEAMEKEMILGDGRGNREIFRPDDRHHFVRMGSAIELAKSIIHVYYDIKAKSEFT